MSLERLRVIGYYKIQASLEMFIEILLNLCKIVADICRKSRKSTGQPKHRRKKERAS